MLSNKTKGTIHILLILLLIFFFVFITDQNKEMNINNKDVKSTTQTEESVE